MGPSRKPGVLLNAAYLMVLVWSTVAPSSWAAVVPLNPAILSHGRKAPALISPYEAYRLKLIPFVPEPGRTTGALLTVHINHGPALRLLLDSGARDLILSNRVARKSGVQARSLVDLVCVGDSTVKPIPSGIAERLDIDQLSLANVPLAIVSSGLPEGIDGIVPTVIFSAFLIHINYTRNIVDLEPYQAVGDSDASGKTVTAHLHNGILFFQATVKSSSGYWVLDTGAAYNAVARPVADELGLGSPLAPRVELETANGSIQAEAGSAGRFRIRGRKMSVDRLLIVSLAAMSKYHGIKIMGLLGFPAFERSSITINYRDHLLTFAVN
jgi:predicted aspartyl protease